MANTFQSGFETTLALRLDTTDTTATLASVPTVTKGRMYLDNWEQKEWIKFTGVSGSTITGLVRGLSQTADPATAWTWLTWIAGTKIKLVAMHDQLLDKNEWDDALISAVVYADTTARDAALWGDWVATINYTNIKTTADWLFWRYNTTTNVWETIDTGTVTANASTTVAWKVEQSTAAQNTAWTATGETGAPLFSTPADMAAQIQSGSWVYWADAWWDDTYVVALTPTLATYTTGQSLYAKVTTANTGACSFDFWPWAKSVKTLDGNDPQNWAIRAGMIVELKYDWTNLVMQHEDFATTSNKGISEFSTDAEFITWTSTTLVPTVSQVWFTIVSWDTLFANGWDSTTYATTYTKVNDWDLSLWWTYKVSFYLAEPGSWLAYARIYVNWVAVGTERSTSSDAPILYEENVTIVAWDNIQIYAKHSTGSSTASLTGVKLTWFIKPNIFTITTVL